MRVLALAATLFLWMCDPAPPPAEHGGVVFTVDSQPLELVAHSDGQLTAYPLANSTARGPTAVVVAHVPGVDGTVHDAPLVWNEPTATFVGAIPVAPSPAPIEIDAILPGVPPVRASTPTLIVVAPAAPVLVGGAPAVVAVPTPPHVQVVPPSRPNVVVEAPRPHVGVVIEPPPPRVGVVIEPPPPVVLVPPGPPGVVFMGPEPRGRVVIEGRDRDVRVDEGRGHFDHGRHGGAGPQWHGGGGGHHGRR